MNCLQRIGRCYEHDLGQIERCAQKVIREFVILRWIKHFKQSGTRVTPSIFSHLIDLIEQKYWIIGLDLFKRGNYDSWHRPDISATVATNLSLVAHTP